MKRIGLTFVVVAVVGTALAVSGARLPSRGFQLSLEARNPVTHTRVAEDAREFQFAIVSDRTGGHRANVFAQAIEKLKLLQPEFVISVGDLIEGSSSRPNVEKGWQEFDRFTARLDMPFFYAAGNHDAATAASLKVWQEKLGRTYYHFVYRDVLFLILNSDDPPGSGGNLGKEQLAYAAKVLADNENARWTTVVVHRPLWSIKNGSDNGWSEVEKALGKRTYTVFCGHIHRYQKYVRNGRNYYQLATTGGGSLMRGVEEGEFDHVVWVTMKKDGPVLANILLDAIQGENLEKFATDEPVERKRQPTQPVRGKAYFEGSPIAGAQVQLQPGARSRGVKAHGIVAADGSFQLSTYAAFDGAVEGEYGVTVVWKRPAYEVEGKSGPNLLPARYGKVDTSGLTATIKGGGERGGAGTDGGPAREVSERIPPRRGGSD